EAGITRNTPNPSGGEILKDRNGEPTGLLRERASGLVGRAQSAYEARRTAAENAALLRKEIDLAIDESLAKGVTTFEDAGWSFTTVDALKRMADSHELRMRIWMMLRMPNEQLAPKLDQYRTIGAGGDYFTVRGIKRQIDGALGSRGAWLLEP